MNLVMVMRLCVRLTNKHDNDQLISVCFQSDFSGRVEFSGVYFIYPNRPESIILKNFKLNITSGMYTLFLLITLQPFYSFIYQVKE